MDGLLADMNAERHVDAIMTVLRGADWQDLWYDLRLVCYRFRDLNLDPAMPDSGVWLICQQRQLVLITGNRNDDGADSLTRAILERGTVESLPVITVADLDRVLADSTYRRRVAERLIDLLIDGDAIRGTGRLHIP